MEASCAFDGLSPEFPVGLRILVVVHDPTELQNLEDILTQCQYKVMTSIDGASAISLLQQQKGEIDLILSEVTMSDMDGLELLKHIKHEFGDIPLVIMTSENDRPDIIWKCLKSGARTYLAKPINEEMLKTIWLLVAKGEENETKENGDGEKKEREEEERRMRESSTMPNKKPRVVWTDDLHKVFFEAVNQLGIDKAVPKKILELMNIKGLTRENVASHLQKYRIIQKREREDARQNQNHGRSCPLPNVEHHLPLQSLRSLSSVLVNTQVHAYNSGPQLANPSNMMIPPLPFNLAAQLANSSNMRAPPLPFNSAAQLANSSNMRAPPLPFNSAAQLANSSNMRAPPLSFNSAAQLANSSNMRAPPLPFNSAAQLANSSNMRAPPLSFNSAAQLANSSNMRAPPLPFNSAAQLANLSNRRPPPPLPSNPDRRLAMQRVPFNQTNYIPSNTGIKPFPGTPPLLRCQSRSDQCFNLPSSQMKVGSVFPVNSIDGPSVPNHPGEQQHVAQQQAEDRELHRDNLLDIPDTEKRERLETLKVKHCEDEFVFD